MTQNSWAPTDARKHVLSFGRYAALGLDGSYISCGCFSSGTRSSYLASHEERSSAQVDLSFKASDVDLKCGAQSVFNVLVVAMSRRFEAMRKVCFNSGLINFPAFEFYRFVFSSVLVYFRFT